MSKEWLLVFGVIFIIDSNLLPTSAEHTNHVHGGARAVPGHALDTEPGGIASQSHKIRRSADMQKTEPAEGSSSIIGRIAFFPVSIVGGVLDRVMHTMNSLAGAVTYQIWNIIKNFVVPRLDQILMRIAGTDAVPKNLQEMISEAHSVYELVKFFGYMKPA